MKLPRYSSTALPRTEQVDPNLVAAAAQAKTQFVTESLTGLSEFAVQVYDAEQQTKQANAIAKTEADVAGFLASGEWEQEVTPEQKDFMGRTIRESRPMEEKKAEDWATIKKQTSGYLEGLTGRRRREAETALAGIYMKAEIEAQAKADKLRVRRAKNTTFDTVTMLQESGNFVAAREQIDTATELGILSPAERKSALEKNREMETLRPYHIAVSSGNINSIEQARAEILTDESITDPDKRMSVYKQLLAEEERLQSEQDDNPVYEQNYLQMLPGAVDGSLPLNQLIANRDNLTEDRFDTLTSIIRARSSNRSSGNFTTTSGERYIDQQLRNVLTWAYDDKTVPFDIAIRDAKANILMNPNIGASDAQKAVADIDKYAESIINNSDWRQVLDVQRAEITGISGGSVFMMSSADNDIEAEVYERLELDFYRAAISEGATFNPDRWISENKYKYRMPVIEKKAAEGRYQVAFTDDGEFDFEGTVENILARFNERINLSPEEDGFLEREEAQRLVEKEVNNLKRLAGR
jgi:hypothetical protein